MKNDFQFAGWLSFLEFLTEDLLSPFRPALPGAIPEGRAICRHPMAMVFYPMPSDD